LSSVEDPLALNENSQRSSKISDQCAVSRKRVEGLLFFEEKITAKKYQNNVSQVFAQIEENEKDFFFHKDLAKAQTAKAKTDFMQDFLGDGLVRSRFWTPQSPAFRQPDFLLLGFLK
jgi:hypothetical protein